MWWRIGLGANAVVAATYLMIAWAIVRPLLREGQLRSNRLGAATAAIFLTCAVHHGAHTVHMLLPYAGFGEQQGEALRSVFTWQMGLWDVVSAAVGVYYWSLRRTYGSLMQGAKLFEDMRQREQQALELNDSVLQGLVVAKMAVELGQPAKATEALDASIRAASAMITELLGARPGTAGNGLLRTTAATLEEPRT